MFVPSIFLPGFVTTGGNGGNVSFHGNNITAPSISLNRYGDSKLNFYTYMLNVNTGTILGQ